MDKQLAPATAENDSNKLDPIVLESLSLSSTAFSDVKVKEVFWHSSAHILGYALTKVFPDALLVRGPPTENGFYYDIATSTPITQSHYDLIEREAKQIISADYKFVKRELAYEEFLELFKNNKYKQHFINENNGVGPVSSYQIGEFVDPCLGPHIPSTGLVKGFKVLKNSSCYFLGDETKDSLQRVYGISFPTEQLLNEHLEAIELARTLDHRVVGPQLDLFFFSPLSPGCAFFLPDGTHIYNKLMNLLRDEYRRRGFKEVITPILFNLDLWKESGHFENYHENMFILEENGLKPMNCPGHCLIFKHAPPSYRQLPMRLADFGVLHRNERSGTLSGLTRVRKFQQDDAHIFCTKDQIESEIKGCLEFVECVYGIFNFEFEINLSTRPEKFMGEVDTWDEAEKGLIRALGHRQYKLNPGDGAFYGPKIDITVFDALKRRHQCATIQLDFQLPLRFNLKFQNNEGGLETPVIVHRAILGSVDRFMAIVLEHYGKQLPFWITPRQIALIKLVECDYEKRFEDFQVHVFDDGLTLSKKVALAESGAYSLILVVGKKEVETGMVSVRVGKKSVSVECEKLVELLKKKCDEKANKIKEEDIRGLV